MALTQVQPGMLGTPQPYAFKNRIINGAMVIDQRNGGALNTPANGGYSVDRWQSNYAGGGVYSCQLVASAPSGFFNSLKLTVTSPDSSIASSDTYALSQAIEACNIADFNQGTVNAKTFTVSFWVQSSVIGTYCVGFRSSSGDAGYAANYTISTANTWTYVSVTVPGTALGTWTTGNGAGLFVLFDLGSGSNRNIPANTWTTGAGFNTASQTPWISTNGATFYLTGVQLEVGTSATTFDYRPYGTELSLCQRYYWYITNTCYAPPIALGQNYRILTLSYPVAMRTAPTLINPTYAGTITRAPDSTSITFLATYYQWNGVASADFVGPSTGGFSAEL
jgi:hypothetical protein